MRRAAAALLVLLGTLGVAGGGGAQEGRAVTVRLLDRTPWVGDGVDFAFSVRVQGAPADAEVVVTVHDRVRSRSEFTRSTGGDGLRRVVYAPRVEPLAGLDPDRDGVLSLGVPLVDRPDVQEAPIDVPGVYPVAIEVATADGEELSVLHTHLVRLPTFDADSAAVPLQAAVVVPIDARPGHVGGQAPPVPDAPLAELAAVLSRHPDVPITLVPTPEVIGAAAAADPDATAALASALGGRQVLAGPWVALDEGAWQRDDPAELVRQRDLGRQVLEDELGEEPDGARLAPPGATAAQLLAMVEGGATALVVREADLAPLEDALRFTLTRPFAVAVAGEQTVPALASDPFLEASAERAATDPVLAAHLLLADLAVLASDQPALDRVATVVLPADAARSPELLDALLGGLEAPAAPPPPTPSPDPAVPTPEAIPAAAPVVVGRTVTAALAAVEPAGVDGEPDADDPLVRVAASAEAPRPVASVAAQVAAGRADVATYEAVFGADDPAVAGLERTVDTAAAAELDAATRRASLDAVRASVEEQLGGLVAPAPQTVTLTAREGRVQLTLTNGTGRPADVAIQLRGDRLVLPDEADGLLEVTLAEATTRVEVRVEARSSGDAPLDVVVLTPDRRIELGRSRITVRTTAVSGVGVALLVTSAAFLVVWWTRTIVRERRVAKRRHPAHARGGHA